MRTTLDIDDDVLRAAKVLASQNRESLGRTVSSLVRRGLAPPVRSERPGGFPVFEVHDGAGPITLEAVNDARDADA